VCEDETMVREIIRPCLSQGGYTVIEAEHGRDAIEKAKNYGGPIHLLITDLVMPQMDGRKLASEMFKTHPGIGTLFISGHTADLIDEQGVQDGELEFMQKPFSINDFTQRVRRILDDRG